MEANTGHSLGVPKKVVILGSTGSIGESALKVARQLGPERMQVVGLAAGKQHENLAAQAKEFGVRNLAFRRGWCIFSSPSNSRRECGGRFGGVEGTSGAC